MFGLLILLGAAALIGLPLLGQFLQVMMRMLAMVLVAGFLIVLALFLLVVLVGHTGLI